jgi:hypothetical protein
VNIQNLVAVWHKFNLTMADVVLLLLLTKQQFQYVKGSSWLLGIFGGSGLPPHIH